MFWVWNMALLRRQEERSAAQFDSLFCHVNLSNTFRDWYDAISTTVKLHQLWPTEIRCYNWRLEGRIGSVFITSHAYVRIFMMGNVSCFLVYIAATCKVGVCVSVHRLERVRLGFLLGLLDDHRPFLAVYTAAWQVVFVCVTPLWPNYRPKIWERDATMAGKLRARDTPMVGTCRQTFAPWRHIA